MVSFHPNEAAVVVCHSVPVSGGKYNGVATGGTGSGWGSDVFFWQEKRKMIAKRDTNSRVSFIQVGFKQALDMIIAAKFK
jgi:hypothetical protein